MEAEHVQIRIFESGLEVWNPGTLPHDISIESLYRIHHSRPRNKLLANAFHRAQLIEHWGTGTLRMIEACEQRGMQRPTFRAEEGVFIVRFESKGLEGKQMPAQTLTERQRKTLDFVRDKESITSEDYQELFDVKKRQAQKDLSAMVQAGLLVVEGRGPSTRYRVRDYGRIGVG